MKVKLDENMPTGLVGILNRYGHNAATVPQQGLAGQSDAVIWEAAQRESRFLITMDLDFADIRRFPPGTHGGILVLRLSRQGRRAILNLFQALLDQQPLGSFERCIVIASERGIRVRMP
jgi:predicted nuclease of predicted toxin-antitoxin system